MVGHVMVSGLPDTASWDGDADTKDISGDKTS